MKAKNSNLSQEEARISKKVESGEINPVHIPRIKSFNDILKFQLCSEIVKYKKENDLLQKDLGMIIDVNKSEVSKLCSYQLNEFSTERLSGMIETLIKSGANIKLQDILEEVKKKAVGFEKKIKPQ